jgi:hypothetical protein
VNSIRTRCTRVSQAYRTREKNTSGKDLKKATKSFKKYLILINTKVVFFLKEVTILMAITGKP